MNEGLPGIIIGALVVTGLFGWFGWSAWQTWKVSKK